MSVAERAFGPSVLLRLWRSGPPYVAGCLIAALWVAFRMGGAPGRLAEDSSTLIPPTTAEQVGFVVFLFSLALIECLLPILLGRWVMAARGTTDRKWFALIWAIAGTMVGTGFNPLVLINPVTAPALIWTFTIPGALIGVIVHAIEFKGRA